MKNTQWLGLHSILTTYAILILHPVACMEAEFQCHNGYGCLKRSLVCDGDKQCLDDSDEMGCGMEKHINRNNPVTFFLFPKCFVHGFV